MRRFRGLAFVIVMAALAGAIYGCALFNRSPVAAIVANPTSGQAPLTVQFSGTSSIDPDGDTLTYTWNFGDGSMGSGATPSHTYTAPGQYTATLTVTDAFGNDSTASQTIFVGDTTQSPVAGFTASPSSGGTPLTVSFNAAASTDPDGSIVSYAWSFGDGGTGSGSTALHTYSSQGTYTATLTVTDDSGLTSTSSQTIVVIDGGQGGCS